MDVKRRDLLGGGALAAAWATGGAGGQALAAPAVEAGSGAAEKNMRLLGEHRARAQMHSLPCAIPGEENTYDPALQSPLVGFHPKSVIVSNDSPITPNSTPAQRALIGAGFPKLALGPTFLSYGPMLAEGNFVVEEWESQIYGGNGTLYNNQYLWILTFEGDEVVQMHEYNDTQHAAIIFGGPGKWPDLVPPTNPRRRNEHGAARPPLPASAIEEVFPVTDKFDLDPRMLVDVTPSSAPAPVQVKPGREGNKALVRGLRKALAAGDQATVNRFYAQGFRHWMGGERPFGWDHLPRQELFAPLVKHIASPLTVRYGPMIADDTRVFEQMDVFARLDDGTVYNNWSAFVHEIRDGKMVQTREYHDPRHMWTVLGRWAPWGATPVEARSRPRRSNLQGIAATIQYPTGGGPDLDRFKPFPPLAS